MYIKEYVFLNEENELTYIIDISELKQIEIISGICIIRYL